MKNLLIVRAIISSFDGFAVALLTALRFIGRGSIQARDEEAGSKRPSFSFTARFADIARQ